MKKKQDTKLIYNMTPILFFLNKRLKNHSLCLPDWELKLINSQLKENQAGSNH